MGIPGMNILNKAMTVIAKQEVLYTKFLERNLNDEGVWMPTYLPPVPMRGSFQPVPQRLYQQYGLDLQKNYATFYVSANMGGLSRDVSCDQISYNDKVYAVESPNDWFAQDGWVGVLCVQVTPEEFIKRFNDRFNQRFD